MGIAHRVRGSTREGFAMGSKKGSKKQAEVQAVAGVPVASNATVAAVSLRAAGAADMQAKALAGAVEAVEQHQAGQRTMLASANYLSVIWVLYLAAKAARGSTSDTYDMVAGSVAARAQALLGCIVRNRKAVLTGEVQPVLDIGEVKQGGCTGYARFVAEGHNQSAGRYTQSYKVGQQVRSNADLLAFATSELQRLGLVPTAETVESK